MSNLHKLFYKDYYNGVSFTLNQQDGRFSVSATGSPVDMVERSNGVPLQPDLLTNIDGYQCLDFQVQYPGLVTGVGIQHSAGADGEFKLGMHFDYTYGLPVIYGSSVKGVLKSYFKECYTGDKDVDCLIADIFENQSYKNNDKAKQSKYWNAFFDAIIIEANSKNRIIDEDIIAPHGDYAEANTFVIPNQLVNPVPIKFLKISSGVKLRFRFKLSPIMREGNVIMGVDEILKNFIEILETFGIGAKTNVGYGQLKYIPKQD
jgi:CRISPR-associated protein Cmr6